MSNLADGVGLSIGLTLSIVSIATIVTGRDEAGVSDVVGMSGGIGIVDGESMSHLADGVGLGLGISLTLAVEMVSIATEVSTVTDGSIARDTAIAIVNSGDNTIAMAISNLADGVGLGLTLSVEMDSIATIVTGRDVAGVADIVGMSGGVGVVDGEAMSHLADGV